jgi:hypothetical protein
MSEIEELWATGQANHLSRSELDECWNRSLRGMSIERARELEPWFMSLRARAGAREAVIEEKRLKKRERRFWERCCAASRRTRTQQSARSQLIVETVSDPEEDARVADAKLEEWRKRWAR